MKNEALNQMADALDTHLRELNISQNQLAKAIGVSSSYITHALARNWDAVPAGKDKDGIARVTRYSSEIAYKIRVYLRLDDNIVWDTRNYQMAIATLYEAKKHREHRIIDGLRGSGKSFAAKMFARQAHGNTFLITASEDMNPKALMEEMALKMGVDSTGNRRKIRTAIGTRLRSLSNPLVIIDECENLKPTAFAAIKALYDDVEDFCGIVLIGANDFLTYIKKRAEAGRGCFPQLWSRFSAEPAQLFTMTRDDVKMIASLNNIEDKATIDRLYQTCQDYRELDRAIKRLNRDKLVLNDQAA